MNSKEARGYVHLAGCECQGTTRKAFDIVLSDSEKLEKIEQIVEEWNNDTEKDIESFDTMERIKEVLNG